ncbi:glycosyltransferase [candidate division KSB1 bacterium]|nr:glycosyltransferase [candidate division KSB1 bacterium]
MTNDQRSTPEHSAAPRKQALKPDYYYANARANLADLVPTTAKTVLDVGCGRGALGALLKSRGTARVIGIEIQPEVAEIARECLDEVFVGDIERMPLPIPAGSADCIILADVLEHLIDPWATLKKLATGLAPHGTVIASIPNIRNLGIIGKLLEGSWTYEEWGILDSTHLRFFALKDMYRLFESAGIEATLVETVRDPLFEKSMQTPPETALDLDLGGLVLRQVAPADLNELTAQQFIFTGSLKAQVSVPPPRISASPACDVSIVIPVLNNLEFTKQCLQSIFTTPGAAAYEVIVVDDGSTDGTTEYLPSLGGRVTAISLGCNRGFAIACNTGAAKANGEFIVFLNNDTVVEPGWLDAMLNCARGDKSIGIVGNLQVFPDTDRVQQAGNVVGADGNFYSIYHDLLPATHTAVSHSRAFQFVAGSCLMIVRNLFEQLGGFDEGFHNSYEDADLCLRAREAGKQVWYCAESRIRHFESKTVSGHAKQGPNHERFMARWRSKLKQDDLQYFAADGFAAAEMLTAHGKPVIAQPTTTMETPVPEQTITAPTSLRIALLTTYRQTCGLAMYAESLVAALRKAGISPTVLAERATDIHGGDESGVVRCWTRDKDGYRELYEILRRERFDVLHINHGGMFSADSWLTPLMIEVRKFGTRIVTTFHATDSTVTEMGERQRLSDRCIVHHPQNELQLVALGGAPDRTDWIPMAIPELKVADIFESKLALGIDPAIQIVSTVGFLDPHKGIVELIEAFADVRKAHPNSRLMILGRPHPHNPAGPAYESQCKARAEELGLGAAVRFADTYLTDEQRDNFLRASDVVVLNYQSRRYEASAALVTALSCGRPVVTSDSPALDTPFAVSLRTTESFPLAAAISHVLTNPVISRVIADNVRVYASAFSWTLVGQQMSAVYQKVKAAEQQPTTDLMRYYATHPDQIYAEPLQRERVRWLKQRAAGNILEIGPANGYVAAYTGATHAADIFRGRLDVCRAVRPQIQFNYGDVVAGLPYESGRFDCVMAPEIFEHVDFEDAIRALRECMRVGRRVLVTLPSSDKPDYDPELVHNLEHRWLVTRAAVETLLREAGATDYEIDVSSGGEFYLLDVSAGKRRSAARETPAAADIRAHRRAWPDKLHLAVDANALLETATRNRGIGRYTIDHFTALLHRLPDWRFTFVGPDAESTRAAVDHDLGLRDVSACAYQDLALLRPDLVYSPHPLSPTTPLLVQHSRELDVPLACTFYDLIPALFAPAYLNHDPVGKQRYTQQLTLLNRECDLFLCISQATAEDIRRVLGVKLERLRVIHAGVTERHATAPVAQPSNVTVREIVTSSAEHLLFVGVPDPRKNAPGMLYSLHVIREVLQRDVKLVIAGDLPSSMLNALSGLERTVGLPPGAVIYPGHVVDDDLTALYRKSRLLLFPSLYEGFGLPIVEAMSAGCPVVAGNNSSQLEVAGDAAMLVNAEDVEDIARAAIAVLSDSKLRNQLIERGRRNYRRFTWTRVADKTAMYLTEFMSRRTAPAALAPRAPRRQPSLVRV